MITYKLETMVPWSFEVPKLIGLTGVMGSGKNTAAAMLQMLGYQETSFAYDLRKEVEELLRGSRDIHNGSSIADGLCLSGSRQLVKEIGDLYRHIRGCGYNVWDKPTEPTVRRLLQLWGTEYRRASDPDYWVKKTRDRIDHQSQQAWVISDVRFPNEAGMVKTHGGIVIRVTGRAIETSLPAHESEKLDFPVDATLDNSGSVNDLPNKLQEIIYA